MDQRAVRTWEATGRADARLVTAIREAARQDRRAVWLWQDYRRAQGCCRELEEHYVLHRVGGRDAPERYPKPAEPNKTSRQQRDEVPRHRLRRLVQAAAGTARDEQDFLDRLRTGGAARATPHQHHRSQPAPRVCRRAARRPQRRRRHQARITLNQLRVELARHHGTDDHATADVNEIITRAARSLGGLEDIISRVHRRLAQR